MRGSGGGGGLAYFVVAHQPLAMAQAAIFAGPVRVRSMLSFVVELLVRVAIPRLDESPREATSGGWVDVPAQSFMLAAVVLIRDLSCLCVAVRHGRRAGRALPQPHSTGARLHRQILGKAYLDQWSGRSWAMYQHSSLRAVRRVAKLEHVRCP